MKNIYITPTYFFCIISAVLLLEGCVTTEPLGISHDMYQGYIPTEPAYAKSVEIYDDDLGKYVRKSWESIPDSLKLTLLPLQNAQVSMRKINSSGTISYMPASVSGEKGQYEVIMDYMKYRSEDVVIDSTYLGSGRIGIGLRIKASVVTTKQNLNLSGLGKLGLEANKENVSGFLSVEVMGLDSKDITNHIPLTAKLDETSIQYALQAIATIKSKIWENGVTITPHVIAVNQRKKDSENIIKESVADIHEFSYTSTSQTIDKWIMPDGENYNEQNKATLLDWMKRKGIPNDSGDITLFIFSKDWESMRKKAVKELKIE